MPLALLLDTVGAGEWLLIFAVLLIAFGPRRLPEIAHTLGRWLAKLHQSADFFREQLTNIETKTDSNRQEEPPPKKPSSDPSVPSVNSVSKSSSTPEPPAS